uniref:DRBM domain-containing protein n=1 Tax=Trichuris muris TaxID=70415 RepID=A0A5S6QRP6_TRIMR
MAKNPIMSLYELSVKGNFPVQFELLSTSGPSHKPTFHFRATAKGVSADGRGSSKQVAKTAAASSLLDLLSSSPGQPNSKSLASTVVKTLNEVSMVSDSAAVENVKNALRNKISDPITALQEDCAKNKWCVPKYVDVAQKGTSDFWVQVSVKDISRTGRGSTKRAAKHEAALRLLSAIKAMSYEEREEKLCFLESKYSTGNLDLDRDAVLTAIFPTQLQRLPESELRALERFMAESNLPSSKHLDFLSYLCRFINCRHTFVSLAKNADGAHFCLLSLTTVPTSVFYGVGASMPLAHEHAAMNALFYIHAATRRIAEENVHSCIA